MATPEKEAELAVELTERAVMYQETPFELRTGGMSHWYVDLKYGLAASRILSCVGHYMLARADQEGFEYEVIAGIGIGGRAVVSGVSVALTDLSRGKDVIRSYAYENHEINSQGVDEYGPHAPVEGKKVWALDDTGTTGDSLVTLNSLMKEFGGTVEHASVVVDRSNGKVAERLGKLGIGFNSLFEFSEETGLLSPTNAVDE